ncbi:MAG: hypothetical protein JSW04_09815 [Desulfobacterales bacterium]|nr:MAG: hypothetical protein JSW04_09815 [Desulfobacterales bacterium]
MKSGTCPKCNLAKVYRRNFPGGYRSALVLAFGSGVRLEDFVCSQCGYVESYLEDLSKAEKIEKHCEPVVPR